MPLTPSPSPSPDLNNNISSGWDPQVIGLVGLIFGLFLLFSYYKILERNNCCASFRVIAMSRNQEQRRRINEHLEEISSQLQSRGLDSYIMNSLPIKQLKKNNYKAEDYQCMECAVCLGKFEEGEWVKHLPRCSHTYHVSCIDTWFQTHSSCPLCRSNVDEVSMPNECSLSIVLESLDREDFHRGRSEQYQVLGSPNWIVSAEHDN